jgi:hypothetical protein
MALTAAPSNPISSFVGSLSGFGMKYPDMRYFTRHDMPA